MYFYPPLFAPAKINLTLKVFNKRSDKFHNLKSLTVFVDIGNIITASRSTADSISIGGKYKESLSNNCHDNTIFKAINWLRKNNCNIPPLSICLIKNIPYEAGLGSGSADAGAIIRAFFHNQDDAYRITKLNNCEFNNQICKIGCDVPACIQSNPLWMLSKGDAIHTIDTFPAISIIIIKPAFGISTKTIYSLYHNNKDNYSETTQLTKNFDYPKLIKYVKSNANDLLSTAVKCSTKLGEIIKEWSSFNEFDIWGMSGSGTALFAISSKENIAKVQTKLNSHIADDTSPLYASSILTGTIAGTKSKPWNQWGQWLR